MVICMGVLGVISGRGRMSMWVGLLMGYVQGGESSPNPQRMKPTAANSTKTKDKASESASKMKTGISASIKMMGLMASAY